MIWPNENGCFLFFLLGSLEMSNGVVFWTEFKSFKRQPHKMVKHIHAIRRQIVDKLLECVWPFWEKG